MDELMMDVDGRQMTLDSLTAVALEVLET